MPYSLFVYGTLKRKSPGGRHPLLREARYVGRGFIAGLLYDLGEYPGVVPNARSGERIVGELYSLPDNALPRAIEALDEYEGHEFVRKRVLVRFPDGSRKAAFTYALRRPPSKTARAMSARHPRKRGAA